MFVIVYPQFLVEMIQFDYSLHHSSLGGEFNGQPKSHPWNLSTGGFQGFHHGFSTGLLTTMIP